MSLLYGTRLSSPEMLSGGEEAQGVAAETQIRLDRDRLPLRRNAGSQPVRYPLAQKGR